MTQLGVAVGVVFVIAVVFGNGMIGDGATHSVVTGMAMVKKLSRRPGAGTIILG